MAERADIIRLVVGREVKKAKPMTLTFDLEDAQAASLLKFLRRVRFDALAKTLDGAEEAKAFTEASERLRVALRRVVEPKEG